MCSHPQSTSTRYLLWDFVHRRVMSRWRVCREWHLNSRHLLRVHRISFLETVRAQHRADCHRKCRACCPAWIHCWNRSQRFWCSAQHRATSSRPRQHQATVMSSDRAMIYFKIAMDNTLLMKILNGRDDLDRKESIKSVGRCRGNEGSAVENISRLLFLFVSEGNNQPIITKA